MEREESSVGISDLIASFLQESLEETDGGVLEVQRNDLAQRFNCVPSQINYVMSTRFSPERGYICLLYPSLDIGEKDALEIYVEGSSVILKKYKPSCVFCDATKDITVFKGKNICPKCLKELKEL